MSDQMLQLQPVGTVVAGEDGFALAIDEPFREALTGLPARPPTGADGLRRGRGFASFFYGIGYGNAIPDIGSAVVELATDGIVEVRCGAVDYGQGARTVFQQIVCDVGR